MNCEHVRDLLPDLARRQLDPSVAAAVQAHLVDCAECRTELDLVTTIAAAVPLMPVGLEPRVKAAVRNRPGRQARVRGRLALAAGIAMAVIGGSALLTKVLPIRPVEPDSIITAQPEPGSAGFIGIDDAFVTGASSLRDLTVEELEKLLVELES